MPICNCKQCQKFFELQLSLFPGERELRDPEKLTDEEILSELHYIEHLPLPNRKNQAYSNALNIEWQRRRREENKIWDKS